MGRPTIAGAGADLDPHDRAGMADGAGGTRVSIEPSEIREPGSGHLEPATTAHRDLVAAWIQGFIRDTDYAERRVDFMTDVLLRQRHLYFWMDPHPVAMAAWVMPTPHGACINFVYAPPELRGRGYGKSVVRALARQMLDSGLEFLLHLHRHLRPADQLALSGHRGAHHLRIYALRHHRAAAPADAGACPGTCLVVTPRAIRSIPI